MHNLDSTRAGVKSCGRRTDEYQDRQPRTRTCLLGKLVYGGGAFSLDCAIRDLSEGGAKVTVERRQFLPFELHLIVAKNCVVHEAKIVWLNFPARGLKFITTQSLNGELPDELRFLRKLWRDLYARGGWDTMLSDSTGGPSANPFMPPCGRDARDRMRLQRIDCASA